MRLLKDLDVKQKKVIVRVDFNVPLDTHGRVVDDTRIRAALPTIKYLLKQKAAIILISHLGRPGGKVVEGLRMNSVAKRLQTLLKKKVVKLDECISPDVEDAAEKLKPGEIILLENVRFNPEEEANNPDFAGALASLGKVFVSDAFGTLHRSHASVVGIAKRLPSAAGFLVEKEVKQLSKLLKKPKKPFVAVLGGAKVSDKIEVIKNLLKKVDKLLIGGAMAYTLLKAQGHGIGNSKFEPGKLGLAKKLLKLGKKKIVLPVDNVVAKEPKQKSKVVGVDIPDGLVGLDIGPETAALFCSAVKKAKTVFWNGPLGMFEVKQLAKGTNIVAKCISKVRGFTVVGGGDSVEAVKALKLEKKFSHVSTGGGAALEFLEGKKLPGIIALEQ